MPNDKQFSLPLLPLTGCRIASSSPFTRLKHHSEPISVSRSASMTVKGSCVCGEWTYEYEGEPAGVAVCHCVPCQKTAGANGSFNLLIPEGNFKKLSGSDLLFSRTGDSGKLVNYKNCSKCATIMQAEIEVMPGIVLVKGGTVDDPAVIAKHSPKLELYRRNAPGWCTPWSGADQKEVS